MKTFKHFLFLVSVSFLYCKTSGQGLVPFNLDGRIGYKSIYGKVVIQPVYENTGWGNLNQFMNVKINKKWGVINRKGQFVIQSGYDDISLWGFKQTGLMRVMVNNKYGFIDIDGREIIPIVYEDTWWFGDGLARVKLNGKWGMINPDNEVIIPIEYDEFEFYWSEGLMGAKRNGKWGFIDKTNKTIIPFDYSEVNSFSEGIANVALTYWKWGYIDHHNQTVIPFIYEPPGGDDNANFHSGIAQVKLGGKYGFINKKGETFVPLKYDEIGKFCKGYAHIRIENKTDENNNKNELEGYIDSLGQEYLYELKTDWDYDWQVTKAPAEIPYDSNLLTEYILIQPDPDFYEYTVFDTSEVYDTSEVDTSINIFYSDSTINSFQDTGLFSFDNNSLNQPIDTLNPAISSTPEPEQEKYIKRPWTLERLLSLGLTALTQEPQSYPDLCGLNEICIAYGMMIGGGNYGEEFISEYDAKYQKFKKETFYEIIGTENLRQITWNWISPFIRKAFGRMNPFVKKAYKDIAAYLKNYINHYNVKKVKLFLRNNEREFAYKNANGEYDPNRKLSAFIDRLIIVHKVVSVNDAKKWINKIADEVAQW